MDIRSLRELVEVEGPFASVYLDSSHDTEDAEDLRRLGWQAVRDSLDEQGADAATLESLDDAVSRLPAVAGKSGRALVGAGGRVLVDELLPAPPPRPGGRVSALPYLLPLVELAPRTVPHVVAVVDRTGADVWAVDGDGNRVFDDEVSGREHPVHKVRGGGWSHLSMQHRVEETVRHNLAEVAEVVRRLAERAGAALVVIAGEVQARTALHRSLPASCRSIAVETTVGQRADGGHTDAELEQEVRRLVAEHGRVPVAETVRRFGTGRHTGLAVDGLPDSLTALRDGNAEALLMTHGALDDTTVWVGRRCDELARSARELTDLGLSEPSPVRGDEAVPMAAVAVGADLVVLDPATVADQPLADGVGVLLRYTTG
jgi:hypothetical protein